MTSANRERSGVSSPAAASAWDAGHTVQDSTGAWWLCTAAGTPGTWQTPAAPGNEWTPANRGLAGWTFDPASCTTTDTTLSAGFIYLMQIVLRHPATLTKLHAVIGTAGSGLTSGQCLAGVYDTAGNRVGVTADMSTTWNSASNKAMNLTGSVPATAGKLYVAFLFNGTTSPTFACGSTLGATFTPGNANLAAGAYRFCRSAAGQTALPATITLSGYTPDANNVWSARFLVRHQAHSTPSSASAARCSAVSLSRLARVLEIQTPSLCWCSWPLMTTAST
ncbi:hypothetical protein QF034_008244 [Streptomyces africanus]|uniref:Uncharacterized protein n=1 Tax=Streptomyces africanus TaxID=231024 RepID=A0ABU0R2X7_9ACTN|nr:hypothetical protein [Streptomyces africanus]MDQ0754013.1 hypothetical protein [Streptomyces africanus]